MAEEYHRKYLGEILIKNGALDQKDLNYVLSKKKITKQRLGNICIQEGLCSEEDVAKAIAEIIENRPTPIDFASKGPDILLLSMSSTPFTIAPSPIYRVRI